MVILERSGVMGRPASDGVRATTYGGRHPSASGQRPMRLDLRLPIGLMFTIIGGDARPHRPGERMTGGAWLLIAGLVLSAGCAKSGEEDVEPVDGPSATVEVRNNYALPVEIFAQGSGINQRLGTVHPGMPGHFKIPPAMLGGRAVELVAVA